MMGLFDGAKGALSGNKAYKLHVDGNKLAGEGKLAEAGEKYQAALRLYGEAVGYGSAPPKILQGYTVLLLRMGEFDRAKALMLDMNRMKNLSDDDRFQLRLHYAILQWRTGELDKAFETIGRAAAQHMNGTVYSTLGMFWVDKARQTGDFRPALEFNLKALDYDDEDAATLDNMGQLYEAMSEAEDDGELARTYRAKALEYYEKAHEQRPRQITTLYCLARMCHRDGDDARARELLSVRDSLYFSALCPVTRQMMDELAAQVG